MLTKNNFKHETLQVIKACDKNIDDIDFIAWSIVTKKGATPFTIMKYPNINWNKLDFEYNKGRGRVEIDMDSTVTFKDGSWLERFEDDGFELWEYKCIRKLEDYIPW